MNKPLLQLLQFTEIEYNNHVFDYAALYAETYLSEHSDACLECSVFWKWFTVQFEAHNKRFVHIANWELSTNRLREAWHRMHTPAFNPVTPSDYIINKIIDYAHHRQPLTYK